MTDTAYSLPVLDTLNTAWEKVKGAKGTFWAVLAIVFAVQLVAGFFTSMLKPSNDFSLLFLGAISLAVGVFIMIVTWGLMYIGIQRAAGQPVQYRMVWYAFDLKLFFNMIGLYVLQILIMACVTTLLWLSSFLANNVNGLLAIIVYIIWVVLFIHVVLRMYLAKAFVIAKQVGPIDAIKASFAATKGNVWRLIGVTMAAMLVLIVSAIPFGIGLIWSLPFIFIAYGELFKRLVTTR